MARGAVEGEWRWRVSRFFGFGFSYQKITVLVCSLNLIVALFVISSLYSSFNQPTIFSGIKYTDDQLKRIEEANQARKAAEPVELMKVVKKLKKELNGGKKKWELPDYVKEELGIEILGKLRGLNETEQKEAVEVWRVEKLKEIKKRALLNLSSESNIGPQEAKILKKALKSDWPRLLEDIGFWMPSNVNNTEVDDKPENAQELEEETIPGRSMPSQCNAELHTDYDGTAVKWGLTFHKESAADCCQACLDQAQHAKPGEKRCNIWVYCPSEYGCYSPDIYEHKHQECWLKQADKPRLNFKGKYSESYRNTHPKAPIVVPWMAGVTSA